jgi:hypothetical protein
MGVAESRLKNQEFGIYLVSVPLHHEYRQSGGIGGTDNLLSIVYMPSSLKPKHLHLDPNKKSSKFSKFGWR